MVSPLIILLAAALSLASSPVAAGKASPTLRELKQAAAANPQDPQAHYLLGAKYESQGDAKKAVREYQTALKLKPDDGQALYRLGRLLGELVDTDPAVRIAKEAVRVNPKSAEARSLLAALYNRQGVAFLGQESLDNAREAFEAGLQAKGGAAEDAALRNNLGCLYVRQDRPELAAATFQAVLSQNPDAAQARYNLALLYYAQGDYQAASQQLFALKASNRDLAGELADYRFRIETSTYVTPPVKTLLTFPGSPRFTEGTRLPSSTR